MTWTVTVRDVAEVDIRSILAGYESEAPEPFPYQVWYLTDPELRTATVIAVVHDRRDQQPLIEGR